MYDMVTIGWIRNVTLMYNWYLQRGIITLKLTSVNGRV